MIRHGRTEGPSKRGGRFGFVAPKPEASSLLEAALATVGLLVFGACAHARGLAFLVPVAGLALVAWVLLRSLSSAESRWALFGLSRPFKRVVPWSVAACLAGCGLALLARYASGRPPLLQGIEPFVLSAAAIGGGEELLFRGYIQGRLEPLGWEAAVVLAALAHTAYKVLVFALPPEGLVIQYGTLGLLTLVVGAGFGLSRHLSGCVWPPLLAHVLFDVLVYGDWAGAPWWVWG